VVLIPVLGIAVRVVSPFTPLRSLFSIVIPHCTPTARARPLRTVLYSRLPPRTLRSRSPALPNFLGPSVWAEVRLGRLLNSFISAFPTPSISPSLQLQCSPFFLESPPQQGAPLRIFPPEYEGENPPFLSFTSLFPHVHGLFFNRASTVGSTSAPRGAGVLGIDMRTFFFNSPPQSTSVILI